MMPEEMVKLSWVAAVGRLPAVVPPMPVAPVERQQPALELTQRVENSEMVERPAAVEPPGTVEPPARVEPQLAPGLVTMPAQEKKEQEEVRLLHIWCLGLGKSRETCLGLGKTREIYAVYQPQLGRHRRSWPGDWVDHLRPQSKFYQSLLPAS